MGVIQIRFNGKALFEAIEENGIEHIRGRWYGTFGPDGKPDEACVLGIAAFNLGIAGPVGLNKNPSASLEEQLSKLIVDPNNKWYIGNPLGITILHWNDRRKPDERNPVTGQWKPPEYKLSWEEVVEMARDLLTPYFSHEFVADSYVFDGELKYLRDSEESYAPDEPEYDDEPDYEEDNIPSYAY